MTMTRTDKSEAQAALAPQADGYTKITFAKPELIMAARADRGHARMTPTEYARHRLGRGVVNADMTEEIRERKAGLKRRQRVALAKILAGRGRRRAPEARRITGLKPGTKRPTSWTSYEVERCITQK